MAVKTPTAAQVSNHNRVTVEHIQDASRVTELVYRSPFKIFQLGKPEPNLPVRLMFSHYGGGMLQGDTVSLKIQAREQSSLSIQSQANAHVFRSEDGRVCRSSIEGEVFSGSSVFINPEPVVLHKGARYCQEQSWNVHKQGKLILVDWMQSGRSDSGECFEFSEYLSRLNITLDGNPLLKERFCFHPEEKNPSSSGTFKGMNHLLSVYLIGIPELPPLPDFFKNPELRRIYTLSNEATDAKKYP